MTREATLDLVRERVNEAQAMTWDGCHKIYLCMDDATVGQMEEYGYDFEEPDFDQIMEWFEESCNLRFIEAVSDGGRDSTKDYEYLIAQGDEDFQTFGNL